MAAMTAEHAEIEDLLLEIIGELAPPASLERVEAPASTRWPTW